MRSVVSILKQAAEEAQENPKVAELKERLINAYPRLFSGVANKNPPDRGRFGTARIKLKPNPKIYRQDLSGVPTSGRSGRGHEEAVGRVH